MQTISFIHGCHFGDGPRRRLSPDSVAFGFVAATQWLPVLLTRWRPAASHAGEMAGLPLSRFVQPEQNDRADAEAMAKFRVWKTFGERRAVQRGFAIDL